MDTESPKWYVLYDGRALAGIDTNDCSVLCTADSEQEAKEDSKTFRNVSAVWYEYDVVDGEYVNKRQRPDIGKEVLLGQ